MSVLTAGPGGLNMLTNFFPVGTSTGETVSSSEIDATYSNGLKLALYGSYSVNSNGTTISGGTVTGFSTFNADGQLIMSISGFSADVQTIAFDEELGETSAITQMFLPQGSTYHGSTSATANDVLVGFGNDTFIGGAATELFVPSAGINTITGGTGANTVELQGNLSAYTVVSNGGSALTVTDSESFRNGTDHISGVQTLKFSDVSATILANGELSLPTASVYQASQWGSASDIAPLTVQDSSTDVVNGLASLEGLATAGKLGAISLTDNGTGFVTLTLTAAQVTADAAALKLISNAVIDVSAATTPNMSFVGTGDPATVVVFSGKESQYQITPTGDGSVTVVDTGTGRTSADHFANVTELQFSDQTVVVANAPATNSVTSGNITELYAAAFGREPDAAGLAYYQQMSSANPSLPLTSFAQKFLASPEYTSNVEHNYAQTTAGETQFVDDLYTNLLHRSPETGAVPFYLNIVNKITAADTPGTQAYTSDDAYAHAVVLTDISQSAEFLNNVQLSGQSTNGTSTSATGAHWLLVS